MLELFSDLPWVLYLTYLQVDHIDLGVSGGLAGVARYGGGSVATSVFTTVLSNTQSSKMASLVHAAATGAGLPQSSMDALLKALPLGTSALADVPGITEAVIAAATAAYHQSYAAGIR